MAGLLNIGEMGALALHTMLEAARLADKSPGAWTSVAELADCLGASRHTLHKVAKRLVSAGLLDSSRGPQGGVMLGDGAGAATLMQILEAVEGRTGGGGCLFGRRACHVDSVCQFCGITVDLAGMVGDYFRKTTISDLLERMKARGGENDWPPALDSLKRETGPDNAATA